MDWARFAPLYASARAWALLGELPEAQRAALPDAAGATGAGRRRRRRWLRELAGCPTRERRAAC